MLSIGFTVDLRNVQFGQKGLCKDKTKEGVFSVENEKQLSKEDEEENKEEEKEEEEKYFVLG